MTSKRMRHVAIAAMVVLAAHTAAFAQRGGGAVRFVEAERAGAVPGTSAAAVAPEDAALAYTGLILANRPSTNRQNKKDEPDKTGDTGKPFKQAVTRLRKALGEVGSGLDQLVKLNVYAADRDALKTIKKNLSTAMPEGIKPAASFSLTALPHGARLGLSAVAIAPVRSGGDGASSVRFSSNGTNGGERASQTSNVSVMPPGGSAYFSGQVGKGDAADAAEETLKAFEKRLKYLNLDHSHVVHVKSFVADIKDAPAVRKQVKEFFGEPAPPLTIVGWNHSVPVEIEMIAFAPPNTRKHAVEDTVEHINPPFLKKSPAYARLARMSGGKRIFVSGLYAGQAGDDEAQIRDIFKQLRRILEKAGSDFDHLVNAHYSTIGREPWGPLHEVRRDLYDPDRAPTSTLTPMAELAMPDRSVAIEMTAVTPAEK